MRQDKLAAYRNWLGVIRGDLTDTFEKGGKSVTRKLNDDIVVQHVDGEKLALMGRSLLFVRNVGHLMTNPAILLPDGSEIPEGIMDAVITSAIGDARPRRQDPLGQQPRGQHLYRQAETAWAGGMRLYE